MKIVNAQNIIQWIPYDPKNKKILPFDQLKCPRVSRFNFSKGSMLAKFGAGYADFREGLKASFDRGRCRFKIGNENKAPFQA
jgi:hypothetical protein